LPFSLLNLSLYIALTNKISFIFKIVLEKLKKGTIFAPALKQWCLSSDGRAMD
jgi:hypothetical protein